MATSVLVVDDDSSFRTLVARMLAGMGLVVVGEAGSVAAATMAAADLRPECVLVDVGLPDGDGVSLARSLAALPWRPRIVLTSSDPEAVTHQAALDAGAAGFVAKDDLPNDSSLGLLTGE
jgi:CheY-like chemotaxis protein